MFRSPGIVDAVLCCVCVSESASLSRSEPHHEAQIGARNIHRGRKKTLSTPRYFFEVEARGLELACCFGRFQGTP
jgi:hypothetical protein